MTDKHEFTEDGLETLFAAERAQSPVPSADLLGRIMADAQTQAQTQAQAQAGPVATAPQRGVFANLLQPIGGWPSLAGMATAGVVGVWIGFSQPAGLDMVAEQLMGTADSDYLVDLVPAFNTDFEEG